MKKDQKLVIGNLKDKILNVPTSPMQKIVPVKIKEDLKLNEIGFHILIPKQLHIRLKVKSTQAGITMKEWIIELLERELKDN